MFNRCRVSVSLNEKVLEVCRTTVQMYLTLLNCALKNDVDGNSLAVQWLGVRTFTAMDLHLIPGGRTKIL